MQNFLVVRMQSSSMNSGLICKEATKSGSWVLLSAIVVASNVLARSIDTLAPRPSRTQKQLG